MSYEFSAAKVCSYCGITLTVHGNDLTVTQRVLALYAEHRKKCRPAPVPPAPPPEHSP